MAQSHNYCNVCELHSPRIPVYCVRVGHVHVHKHITLRRVCTQTHAACTHMHIVSWLLLDNDCTCSDMFLCGGDQWHLPGNRAALPSNHSWVFFSS